MPLAITGKTTAVVVQDSSPSGTSGVTWSKRLVSNTALTLLASSDVEAIKAVAFGDALDYFGGASNTAILGRMRLRSTQLVAVPGSEGFVFDAVLRFDSLYTWADVPTVGAVLLLPVETELDATPRSVLAYRSGANTPTSDLSTTTDILGTPIDYGGKPVQTNIPQQTMRVSLIIDSSLFTLTSVFDRIASHSGKWNTIDFLHFLAQTVFCESASISHIRDEYYRVTYLFRSDYWFGCDQVPKIDVWGKAEIDANGAAKTVTWKSVAYGAIDHNLIFNEQAYPTIAKQWAKEGSFLTYP